MSPPSFGPAFIPSATVNFANIVDDKTSKKKAKEQSQSYRNKEGSNTEIVGITNEESALIPNHFTADRDPTPHDDFLDGWREGSKWYNITKNKSWICVEATPAHTLWRLMENIVMYPERLEYPIPVTGIGNNQYRMVLPENTMINNILSVYIKNQCSISSGFNFNNEDLSITLDMSDYPNVNFDGKQAYVTCVRRGEM